MTTKSPRKKSTVLGKSTKPAKKEQLKIERQNLAGLRATLRGYKADRVQASKALRAPTSAFRAASRAVATQERAVLKAISKVAKLAA